MTTIQIILKLLPYIACVGIPTFLFVLNNIKKNREHKAEVESLKDLNKKVVDAEKEKGKIRDEHGKKEDDILANPAGDHNVLPVSTEKPAHNHPRGPCGKDCPAYDPD